MREGNLLYRNRTKGGGLVLFTVILMFVIFWGSVLFGQSTEETLGQILGLSFATYISVAVCWAIYRDARRTPGFYEFGIGYFEKDKMVRIESYEMFTSVECYFRRNQATLRATPKYGLVFRHLDGSVGEMEHDSIEPLLNFWRQIVSKNPSIVRCLKQYVASKLDSRAKFGTLEMHFGTEILFEVLKNNQY